MYGICDISCVPIRKETSHRSEQVSELLFGDSFEILDEHKEWIKIKCSYDNYEGWILNSLYASCSGIDFKNDKKKMHACSYDILQPAISKHRQIPILIGSSLPHYDGMIVKLDKEKFTVNGRVTNPKKKYDSAFLLKTANQFLHAPYRWGGKTPFGIDCSGFTQMVFKIMNVRLLRDAHQQATQGEFITFINEAITGDLAFFGAEDKVSHVGIIIDDGKIIHASGKVKIDKIDQNGIFNVQTKTYSHKLRFIKRMRNFNL
jgi:hypothetical protein